MVSTGCLSPPAQMSSCRVHRRVWIEEYHDWVACLEPPLAVRMVTEAACDTCLGCAFEIFRTPFPGLYASRA